MFRPAHVRRGDRQHPIVMAGKAVTKVVNRCYAAKESQNLYLADCQLVSFPDAIYHLMRNTVVLSCDLSFNLLRKVLPKFAIKFTNITDLNLSHNQLSSLPEELREMTDLQRLDISHNDYPVIPKVVFKLPQLAHLNAQKNYIMEVDVTRLKSSPELKEINLEQNPLSKSSHDQLQQLNSVQLRVRLTVQPDFDLDEFLELKDLCTDTEKKE